MSNNLKGKAVAEVFEDGEIQWSFSFEDEKIRRFDLANLHMALSQLLFSLLKETARHDTSKIDPEAN